MWILSFKEKSVRFHVMIDERKQDDRWVTFHPLRWESWMVLESHATLFEIKWDFTVTMSIYFQMKYWEVCLRRKVLYFRSFILFVSKAVFQGGRNSMKLPQWVLSSLMPFLGFSNSFYGSVVTLIIIKSPLLFFPLRQYWTLLRYTDCKCGFVFPIESSIQSVAHVLIDPNYKQQLLDMYFAAAWGLL